MPSTPKCHCHARESVDAAIGTFIEYGTTNRDKNKESYAELWHRWIYEERGIQTWPHVPGPWIPAYAGMTQG
jgi:hypothetical protein